MFVNQIKKCFTVITSAAAKSATHSGVTKTQIRAKSLPVLFLFSVLLLLSAQSVMADPQWTLVWDAEFKGPANSSPDPTYWTYDTGGGGWGNGELETYTNTTANAYQDGNGHLVIQALYNNGNYTSARMKTQGVFDQAYGLIEASIQLPAGGSGIWPAFWMLGQNIGSVGWPACGEIDMMEDGLPWSNTVFGGHVHGPMPGGGDYNGGAGAGTNTTLPSGTVNSGFHTYGVQWSPNQIQFFVDGSIYQTLTPSNVPGTWVFGHPFFILLNLAVGGPSGSPGGTAFPQQMLVNYVRVYKLTDNGTSPHNGAAATVPGTVQAENYDTYNDSTDPTEPGEGFAYNALQTGNTSGQYRTGDAVSIENCSDAGGGYDVDWTSPGQWMQYTLNVAQSGSYNIDARVSSSGQGGTFHFDLDGTPITGEMTCPDTGGWQNWQDVVAGAGSISAGQHVLLLVEDTMGASDMGVCNINSISMSLVNPPTPTPTFTPTTIPPVCASWITNGSAFVGGKGVTLTTATNSQAGSAWNSTPINLSQNFNMTFMTYFGTAGGADGIDFVLQKDVRGTTALGFPGGDKGYAGAPGITPSVAFDLESYGGNGTLQVLEDGNTTSTCGYAGSACPYVFASNISNQMEHTYQVVWNAAAKTLTLIFDGSVVMVYNRDLINAVFGGSSSVYYGFTAATGGSNNLQYVYEVGCAMPTSTFTATFTPTVTATATLTYSRTNTFTETATATCTGMPSDTFTPSASGTITVTPYFSFTATQTLTPAITFTAPITETWTFTAAATAASTGTLTPYFTSTPTLTGTPALTPYFSNTATYTATTGIIFTATQTVTPSFTASPAMTAGATATLSVGPSATESQTLEATAVFAATQSETTQLTTVPTDTPAQTFTATLTPQISITATPGTGLLVFPDPYDPGDKLPMHASFNCAAGTVSIKIQFWSRAFRLIRQYETSLSAPEATQGKIDLDSSIFENFSNGIYYITAITSHGGAGQAVSKIEKFLILRKNRP
jgi:beta-glucanase (GH16 family)